MNAMETGDKEIINNLHKLAREGKARDVEAYLEKMQTLYWKGHVDLKPGVRHYKSILNVWAKSTEEGRELRAQQILDWMCHLHNNPFNIKPTKSLSIFLLMRGVIVRIRMLETTHSTF